MSEQFGRVLDCFHDIVGGERYTEVVDAHKTVVQEEEVKQPLPETGEEIPEVIEGEEEEEVKEEKLPGEDGAMKETQRPQSDVAPDEVQAIEAAKEGEVKEETRDFLREVSDHLNTSKQAVSLLTFEVTTVAKNIKELSTILKNPPFKEQIDEEMKQKMSLLTAISRFPYQDLTRLKSVIESSTAEIRQLIGENDALFTKLAETDELDVFGLRAFEALAYLKYFPISFLVSSTIRFMREALTTPIRS